MPIETKNIGDILAQLMETENIPVEKLSTLTNIPSRFIIALREGEFAKLPAEPYVRGYLIKIAPMLKVESEMLISAYKDSIRTWKGRSSDELPGNLFVHTPIKKGWLFGVLIVVAMLIFTGVRLKEILGVPNLVLNIPETSVVDAIQVDGQVRPGDKVTLNGEAIYTDEAGKFEYQLNLASGTNTFEFGVARFLGKTIKVTKQVEYTPSSPPATSSKNTESTPQNKP